METQVSSSQTPHFPSCVDVNVIDVSVFSVQASTCISNKVEPDTGSSPSIPLSLPQDYIYRSYAYPSISALPLYSFVSAVCVFPI